MSGRTWRNGRAAWCLVWAGVLGLAGGAAGADLYVDAGALHPVPPYADWSTAAVNIQDAVDWAAGGDVIWVAGGTYSSGGVWRHGGNRVGIDQAITLRSVAGPEGTWITGAPDPDSTNGLGINAVRCVWLGSGARLEGFTLANGATWATWSTNGFGGGVCGEDETAVVSNCVLAGNAAHLGGGAHGGRLENCVVVSNRALFGGGVCEAEVTDSRVEFNEAASGGGGAYQGGLVGCVLAGNEALDRGGGAYLAVLTNCTLEANRADSGGGGAQRAAGQWPGASQRGPGTGRGGLRFDAVELHGDR